ncbi:HDIG domain-containing protein [Persicimonas caeni]|uniref:HDIG domain-containing protein n=1 Tax=Persicimonas caeni TaxID=2292766 RepID=A0A4Y6Q3S8_PERCE|nr:HDIG domain-containing metalloprotein [Persicimonas caeni]QDG54645.1 HDIG domain-containing protein [Persicimonas caeni]QED35866.1 HDIG domain-containing protein [Persicimonas caeni]
MPKSTQSSKSVFSPSSGTKGTRLERLLRHPLVQFVAFGVFVAALVAIVTASFDVSGPSVQEKSIGEVAPSDIKATRDFTYTEPDVAATNALRERVAKSVPPVFDWQEGMADQVRERIDKAFASMRTALAERAQVHLQANRPQVYERIDKETSGTDAVSAWLEPMSQERLISWSHELRAEKFDPYLDTELSEASFETFAREGFSERTENALENVVGRVLSNMIVPDMGLIDEQQDRGIYLRRLRGDKLLIEYHITDVHERFVPMARTDNLVQRAVDQVLSPERNRQFRRAILSAASALVRPNTTYNESKTVEKRDAAREAVSDVVIREEFRKGQIVVEKGHIITERHYRIIDKMLEEDTYINRTQIIAGITLLVLLLVVTFYVFGRKNVRHFRPTTKDIVFMATSLVLMLSLTWLLSLLFHAVAEQSDWGPASTWYFLVPVAAGGMLIRLVLNNEHAIVFTIVFAALVGLVTGSSLYMMTYTLVGALVGIGAVQQVKHRMALMWSGLAVGAVNVAAVVAFILLDGELFQIETLRTAFFAFASGVTSGFFVLAVLPLFETVFGYTTDIKLLELANLNHPLLRELIIRAPGSYHHSMMVGSLSEAAAESVGANPLLCRVGSYYHDIGKAKNPQYFAENQKVGENPHDKLKPNMSALIIKAHVKDGLEMARQHRLPREIQDFIAQHHGTSLIAFFYHKAKQMEDPDIPEVDEKDYRYPGPKPQSRETAICMLADGIEAASRALPNPSPARLKGLVQKMINKAFTDGQLDECDLTLKDLNSIAKAFTRILTGIYHHRPEYPEQAPRRPARPEPQEPAAEDTQRTPPARGRRGSGAQKAAPAPEPPKAETSLADVSSDVWEITKEKVESMQKETDAGRSGDSGKGERAPKGAESASNDSDEGRESLPRLGTN